MIISIYVSGFATSLLYRFILGNEQPTPFSVLSVILIFPLIYFSLLKGIREKLFRKDALGRVIIDKDRGIIRFETEKKGKLKLNAQYNTSVVKYVKVVVYRRNKMGIHLDFHPNTVTEPFNASQIIGPLDASDNEEILKLAHRIGELLGVPVIEKR